MEQKDKKIASNQSLIKGLSLIEILSNFPNGCPLAKLADLAQLNKSTTHRMLQSLQSCGYVKAANTSGSYRLTTKCLAIGQKTLSSLNILTISSPYLEELNLNTGETINLSMKDGFSAIMIHKFEPTTGMIKTRSYLGQRLKLYCSAMGKIFLAYDTPNYLEKYWYSNQDTIQCLTTNTITTLEKMEQELENIKLSQFSIDNEENELGITCLACPIFDINEKVNYSVSISLSTARLKTLDKNLLLQQLKQTANAISTELGAKTRIR